MPIMGDEDRTAIKREFLIHEIVRLIESGERGGDIQSYERLEGEPVIAVEFPRGERFFITIEDA